MDTHHVGMKINIHPDKRVEVEMHHMPSPAPGASMPGGAPAVGGAGMVQDPMADGMKAAMDAALPSSAPIQKSNAPIQKSNAPIQKPDATRGGSESSAKKAKPADKSVGKKPAANKAPPSKAVADKGKNVKNTSAEKKVATGSKK